MFNPSEVFRTLYRQDCLLGIQDFSSSRQLSTDLICADIESHIISMFSEIKHGRQSAVALRRRSLEQNSEYCQQMTHRYVCLICLQRNVEHTIQCGHTMCDVCVAIFAAPTRGMECYYSLTTCLFCQENICFQARLLPPTCRARLVAIDGGGARGIISLEFIEELRRVLNLWYPVQEHLDLIVGTSSGKPVAWLMNAQVLISSRWSCGYWTS